ncbi:MAG: hypothetical protein JSW50_12855 [Candidatus Latescibacterota bacterium]|nr:MAG: hypothetical protein JSW50_12855 [Candidatus Latescibacterota bacterium]
MTDHDARRRQLLQMIATAPLALALGCDAERGSQSTKVAAPEAKEALRKLIVCLGPWSAEEKTLADDFAARFVESRYTVGSFLPGSAKIVQSLAERFPTGVMADEVDLGPLSTAERELLTTLVQQIYSFVDVRFHVAKEPPFGQCVGDPTWHTKAPEK